MLYRQGYNDSDIAISPSYPLTRFTVEYTNTLGIKDNFMIEIGYMRRYPILKTDTTAAFKHVCTRETFPIKTPTKEELFANKLCALLYRKTSRDLFDVYQIAQTKMNLAVFRKCAIVDSLMRGKPKLHEINIEKTINEIPIDSSLKNLLQTEKLSKIDPRTMTQETIRFIKVAIAKLTQNDIKAIDQFYQLKTFKPDLIDKKELFHEKIKEHPAILWELTNLT